MISREAFRFFHANAGYVVGRRALGALRLARAEAYADGRWLACWRWDEDGDLGDHALWCDEARRAQAGRDEDGNTARHLGHAVRQHCDHEIEYVSLKDGDGNILASLGGIIDASDDYRRVVEAELASEALHEIESHERNDRESATYLAL